ncbi:MAG: Nif3-like dinuclear metal center hexameric protein [Syntrophomonadaceae bacterium]|jgi:dinuclear metal center YbgI/SA1388 family protein
MQVQVKDVVSMLDQHFPSHLAETWDNVGLQVGSYEKTVNRIAVALDLDQEILQKATAKSADLIITHHPLFFQPFPSICTDFPQGKLLKDLLKEDITVFSAHTNMDAAEKGLNQYLAEKLGLQNIHLLLKSREESLCKLVVFVPMGHEETVRQALSQGGAGVLGQYSDTSFRTAGIGTFRPQEGSNPFIGSIDQLEEVEEFRLETVAYERDIPRLVDIMKKNHPYEEVAYDVIKLENPGKIYSMGRKGYLPAETDLYSFAQEVKRRLNLQNLRLIGNPQQKIKTVAVISGSGKSLLPKVYGAVDVLVTGDIGYHEAKEALARGLAIIDAGHQETEEIIVSYLCQLIDKESELRGWSIETIPLYSPKCFTFI